MTGMMYTTDMMRRDLQAYRRELEDVQNGATERRLQEKIKSLEKLIGEKDG